ncbi:MAG: hypothetical protein JW881_21325 [Spirochaetales bacterium]|nr:hypothetical protein [Spirochaetales bacterium]
MPDNERKEKRKTNILKAALGTGIVLCYVLMGGVFPATLFDTIVAPLFMCSFVATSVLTGFLAKRLGRSGAGWGFGTFFTGLVPSVVLLFLGKKKQLLLREKYEAQIASNKIQKTEKVILSIAQKNKGKVTPALVALEADIGIEEAHKKLDELVRRGFVSMEVTKGGAVVYIVPEFSDEGNDEFI